MAVGVSLLLFASSGTGESIWNRLNGKVPGIRFCITAYSSPKNFVRSDAQCERMSWELSMWRCHGRKDAHGPRYDRQVPDLKTGLCNEKKTFNQSGKERSGVALKRPRDRGLNSSSVTIYTSWVTSAMRLPTPYYRSSESQDICFWLLETSVFDLWHMVANSTT